MLSTIALIEELAANAVPPLVAQDVDGWRLRYGAGVTRRANSILALYHRETVPLETKIALAEAFYAQRGMLCRFQLCPASQPTDLEPYLADRGYSRSTPTEVKTAALASLAAQATAQTQILTNYNDDWLTAYAEGEGGLSAEAVAAKATMLSRIGPQTGFAALHIAGELAAVALGVVERGYLGIFSVSTRPAYRRQGLATIILTDLAAWAVGVGANQAYLQVMSTNLPAQQLYQRFGFSTCYEYWYRERKVS